jgi:hypothetical protein
MKVIFLDFDGVLNTSTNLERLRSTGQEMSDEFGHLFDPACVEKLHRILQATDAKIVVSSSWRWEGLDAMQKMWKARNLPGEIIDITPKVNMSVRGVEIRKWLGDHRFWTINWSVEEQEKVKKESGIESFVIIDDDSDMLLTQKDNFVKTSWKNGLLEEHVQQSIDILMK